MKITIDTQVDTHEDIRKILQILTGILEKKEINQTADTTSMMGIFNDNPVNDSAAEKSPDTPPDFSAFLNLASKKAEKKEEQPRIEYF